MGVLKLTYALNNIKNLISQERGYEAILGMRQVARSYGVTINELEELIELGSIKHSLQTILRGDREERIDALVKLAGGGQSEPERLNSLKKIELKHFFYLLLKALRYPLECEFDQVITDVITRLTILLENYYQWEGSEEQIMEIEALIADLSEVSIDEFEGVRERFFDIIDIDHLYRNHYQVYDYAHVAWEWMCNLNHCINFLNLKFTTDCFLYVYD